MDDETRAEIERKTGAPVTAITPEDAVDAPWSTWTERQIAAGRLSPGARGMSPTDAADQYNQSNALEPADHGFMYAPAHAQETACDVLALIGIVVDERTIVMLTDGDDTGAAGREYRPNPGQLEAACEEHRLCTGETISAEALLSALPWSDATD
ncbi:MAG: hypothetical protein WBA05_02425 [Gordonia sp. (in: high G+C Gram-positive bacteria)]|uniref:hypothetical protein n=1 Tax=Gordonia sp. (in: high G+C Gram-positive bacteria) TaxID=84139 RepID=UPI003C732EE1